MTAHPASASDGAARRHGTVSNLLWPRTDGKSEDERDEMTSGRRNGDEAQHGQDGSQSPHHERRMYLIFGAMIATSSIVMFLLTYTNTYEFDHMYFSEERMYMTFLMGAAMAIVMLGFMRAMMYKNDRANLAIVGGALALGLVALFLSRSQILVDGVDYMEGMIPHHSIAILTSERAQIDDVRVEELACEIIVAQRREIAEMKWLIADIREHGVASSEEVAEERPVPSFEAAC